MRVVATPALALVGPLPSGDPTIVLPHLTSIEFRCGTQEAARLVLAETAERILAAVDGAHRDAESSWWFRLRLPRGAEMTVTLGRPSPARAHHGASHVLTGIVQAPRGASAVTDEAFAALRRVPLTALEMAELVEQMPVTTAAGQRLGRGALTAVAPVLVIHHMLDFLVMVEAITAAGVPARLITVLDKGYRYRHTERVDAHLRSLGVAVWPWQQAAEALVDHVTRARAAGRSTLVADDGGYVLPVILTELADLAKDVVGLVEQTKSGIGRLRCFAGRVAVPIFSVAESRLKATVESWGIADAAVRNVLALLPDEKWEGQAALVLGYGRIGEQVADVLRARRMRVAVFDPGPLALVAAHERGFLTSRSLCDLLVQHRPRLVVGASGHTSLRGDHLEHLCADTYLVSVTSRQREFALDEFAELALTQQDLGRVGIRYELPQRRAVTVLADGYPVNFHYAESLPNRYSDLILAAMLVGVATLAAPSHGFGPGHNVARTDAALAASGLAEHYYRLHGPSRP